ncbi:hypothetical protein HMPREF0281_01515 [Corynebacterium ammoniagenes DSM 20306]|uniref:Uncharacterized protein n=1 Tax=Corynebacterium ammoniagenes DSM 20306 TaxID=649754 RepID=A0ABN0AEY0_CORAM|nr:hypothetical protein HMPREF0281_01515 [Corynebacterium ammoniagenes DSM 20306]
MFLLCAGTLCRHANFLPRNALLFDATCAKTLSLPHPGVTGDKTLISLPSQLPHGSEIAAD